MWARVSNQLKHATYASFGCKINYHPHIILNDFIFLIASIVCRLTFRFLCTRSYLLHDIGAYHALKFVQTFSLYLYSSHYLIFNHFTHGYYRFVPSKQYVIVKTLTYVFLLQYHSWKLLENMLYTIVQKGYSLTIMQQFVHHPSLGLLPLFSS